MSNPNPANHGPAHPLPERANLDHLRKEAKQRLKAMRIDNPGATLAAVQLAVAREYGFTSWRRLVAYVKAQRDKEAMNKDERTREERFRKIREYELMKQEAELKLEALREAYGATLTQEQEARLNEELSHSARELEEYLRRPGNKVMATSEFQEQEQEFDAWLLAQQMGIKAGRGDELAKLPQIPMQQAIQIATAQQPGTVLECRLAGRVVEDLWLAYFDVRITSVEGAERTFTRFAISAIDGRILGRIDQSWAPGNPNAGKKL